MRGGASQLTTATRSTAVVGAIMQPMVRTWPNARSNKGGKSAAAAD
jgi:hypothetical protein